MLAQLERQLPRGERWVYEPKLDGFRGLLWHQSNGRVQLLSRNLRDLAPYFPELVTAGHALPPGTLVDGEIVVADQRGAADFSALQGRLSARGRAAASAGQCPAVLLAFDLVELGGVDVNDWPLVERRYLLERLLTYPYPCIQIVEQTHQRDVAEQWLALLPTLEGAVAKRVDSRYEPGARGWVKVKRLRTADCVVMGVAGADSAPSLVLGLRHSDGELHHLGRLGGVICHLEWTRSTALEPGERLLRGHGTEQQGSVRGDEPVPVGAAFRKASFEAAPLHSVASFHGDVPLSGDSRRTSELTAVVAYSALE